MYVSMYICYIEVCNFVPRRINVPDSKARTVSVNVVFIYNRVGVISPKFTPFICISAKFLLSRKSIWGDDDNYHRSEHKTKPNRPFVSKQKANL